MGGLCGNVKTYRITFGTANNNCQTKKMPHLYNPLYTFLGLLACLKRSHPYRSCNRGGSRIFESK